LGSCLADDMGLGKTVQTLALIQHDRTDGERRPVLLVCPTSVVNNWRKEAARFTPELPVLVHHGIARNRGPAFQKAAAEHAIVLSTYALLHRDQETLARVDWAGVILDEAQNVKNAGTKQARAARSLPGGYRIALTGTPVENNVGDLWSLMEFLNPSFLGSESGFRKRFFVPIQVYADRGASDRLKRITSPFILRRLKTDKSIIADLPDKLEMKVFCNLTKNRLRFTKPW
jgi:SNF2 family DNA or RNA helicase